MNRGSKLTILIIAFILLYLVFSIYEMRSAVNHLHGQSLKLVATKVSDKELIYLDKVVLNNLLHIHKNLSKASALKTTLTQDFIASIRHLLDSENTSKEVLLSQYWKILSVFKTPNMEAQLESINENPIALWATAVGLHSRIQNFEKKNSLQLSRDIGKATLTVWTHIPLVPELRDSIRKLQNHPFLKHTKSICVFLDAVINAIAPYRACSSSANEYFNSYSHSSEILCADSQTSTTVEIAGNTIFVSCKEKADIMLAVILDMSNSSTESQMLKVFKENSYKSWLFSKVIGKELEGI